MPRIRQIFFLLLPLLLLLASGALAADRALEKTLRDAFQRSRTHLAQIETAMLAGTSPQSALTKLKTEGAVIRTDHGAYLARLQERRDRLDAHGNVLAMTRHAEMEERYGQAVSRYLTALDALLASPLTLAQVKELQAILAEILPEQPYRIHGSLPYRHLNLPSRRPVTAPVIVPAYQGGTTDFAGADLVPSPEAPITPAIAGLARSLGWSPVAIYEWVKNNFRTEWYWGAMKGAEETLRQLSGNDADQAALLVALLRAAGYPARYVRGVAEFFPDIETAKAQTGLDDPLEIARLLQKGGIPCETVISGGRISNLRFEHIWVEAQIPYANYRGAVLDEQGQTWLALDTSIKTAGYSENSPPPALADLELDGIRTDYLTAVRSESPVEFLRTRINEQLAQTSPGTSYAELLLRRTINREEMQILPAGLQFTAITVTGEYAALPDYLLHRVRFTATTVDRRSVFDQTLPVFQLANRSLAVTFEPETIEDQEIMNSYGGLDLTPLYLIRLRPVLTVNGRREIIGRLGLAAGADFTLTTELIAPATSQRIENTLVAGYPTVIGLAAQQAPALPTSLAGRNAERLLCERAVSYLHQGNQTEEEFASLLHLTLARPLPTLVTVGGVLDVVALLDAPLGSAWQGLYLDADLRAVEVLGGSAPGGSDPAALFMELAGLHHSALEHRVFEEGFGVGSVSTAKMLAKASESGLPIQSLNGGNIDAVLPGLNLPPAIAADIAASVHQGYQVTLPATMLNYEDWSGYAYLVEGSAGSGWMLAGSIAGGMTALNPERWPQEVRDILTNPDSDFSDNPLAAVELRVIRGPGLLAGTAGAHLPTPLLVVALDREGRLVKGVTVHFTVRAGGGTIRPLPTDGWSSTATVTTGQDGRARVELRCPESTTASNPTTARNPEDMRVQRVDETVIEVVSDTGLQTDAPVSVYTFPGEPEYLNVRGDGSSGTVLTWAATLVATVEDKFNNPINKVPVHFSMGTAQPRSACASQTDNREGLLVGANAPCMKDIPVYNDCGSQSLDAETALHAGAVAQVMLGGMPDAVYPVAINAGDLHRTVTVTANPTGPCDPGDAPYSGLALRLIHTVDNLGHIIDGGPMSKENDPHTIPLLARLFFIREREEVEQYNFNCFPGSDICPVVVGTGMYDIDTNFVSATVSFDGTQATPLGDGRFRVNFPLAEKPQKKEFQVTGQATEKIKVTAQVCDQRNDCLLVEQDLPSSQITLPATVYAVDITLDSESYILPVNEQGHLTYDTNIPFTIAPPEYTAATSYVVLKKQGTQGKFENIAFFNAKPAGQDEMTFLRGFGLDLNGVYKAQVVLNEGSEVMEVRSREMTLQPLALELDADLNHDGQFSEDDPAEHLAPGLVVPLNRDDDDKDGVPDFIDGYNANGITPDADDAMTVVDDDLIEVRVTGLPPSLAEGSVTLAILEGAEKIKVWTDPAKAAGSVLLDGPADPFAAAKTWVLGTDINTLADLPTSLYIEGVDPSTDENDGAILVFKYHSAADPTQIETDRLRVTVLPSAIVPDYNRDGKIDDLDRNKVTEDKPWQFWVNDDGDGGADAEGIGSSADDLPGQNKDNSDNQVNTIRDLLDFFPLYLDISQALTFWPPADGYEYVIKDSATPAEGISGLAVVEGLAGCNVLSADQSYTYLQDPELAVSFAASAAQPLVPEGVMLSAGFLDQVRAAADKAIILVEGRKTWTGKITMEVRKDGAIMHMVSLPLEITGVEEMFGHKNLRGIAGATDGDPDRYTDIDPQTNKLKVGPDQEIGKQPYCMQKEDKSLVWMHGYNVSPESARATFAEVFKRFFHTGLTGRFYGVSWFGDPRGNFANPTAPLSPHYHEAVVNAFATAGTYTSFINSFPDTTSIAAHSLGNLVVGSAIQDHGLANFAKYFAIDAAVALEAYGDIPRQANGQVLLNSDMVNVEDWPDYMAAGQSRLLASEWHRLFSGEPLNTPPFYPPDNPPPDNRALLTWRGRLAAILNNAGSNIYNFYSSAEDVLRAYPGDDLVWDEAGSNFGMYSWVKQEKFKGRRDRIGNIPHVGMDVGGASSNYCGWSFSSHYWKLAPDLDLHRRYTPEEAAAEISDDDLKIQPFFALDIWHLYTDPSSIIEPNLDNIVNTIGSVTPSDFAMKKVSETDLTSYYTYNKPAHEHVLVRDWLLAEAFPATTLPMGANINSRASFKMNDLQGCS